MARLRAAFRAVEDALITRTVRRVRRIPAPLRKLTRPALFDVPARPAPADTVRVLRWVFSRDVETLTCELTLSDDDACYALRIFDKGSSATRSVEHFAEVVAAFERQSAVEGALVKDGWSLDSFESLVFDRKRRESMAV